MDTHTEDNHSLDYIQFSQSSGIEDGSSTILSANLSLDSLCPEDSVSLHDSTEKDILTNYINYNAAIERCCFEKKVVGDNENWECKVSRMISAIIQVQHPI